MSDHFKDAIGKRLLSVDEKGYGEDTEITLTFDDGVAYVVRYHEGVVYSEWTSDSGYLEIRRENA